MTTPLDHQYRSPSSVTVNARSVQADCQDQTAVACRLTATGRGAIAVVGVCGPVSHRAVLECFKPATPLTRSHLPVNAIRFGVWLAAENRSNAAVSQVHAGESGHAGESVVVCATDLDEVEVHCHGGKAAVDAILDDLRRVGVTIIDPVEYEARRRGPNDCLQLEKILQQTNTPLTAAIVLSQLRGAFAKETREIANLLASEDKSWQFAGYGQLKRIADRRPAALHLVTPWNVVIAGPPNVGKSSLLNRLLGYKRAITFDAPGTTRDVILAESAIGGWPVRFSDTAGIRSGADDIESEGVQRALCSLQSADIVLLVVDAREGLTAVHQTIAQRCVAPVLLVINKTDLMDQHQLHDHQCDLINPNADCKVRTVGVSAKTGEGIERLETSMLQSLMPQPVAIGDAVPLLDHEYELISQLMSIQDRSEQLTLLKSYLQWN